MLEFYTVSNPKAKKEHICDLCGGRIGIGEKYVRDAGKYGGDMFDCKYHAGCYDIIQTYCLEVGTDEYDDQSVHDWLREEICPECCTEEEREDCFNSGPQCTKVLGKIPKGVYRND